MSTCGNCGAPVLAGYDCPKCGWSPDGSAETRQQSAPRRGGRECEWDGCHEAGTQNIDGKWYCRGHIKEARTMIEKLSMTPETREQIRVLNEYAEQNGLKRREDESREQYVRRCKQYMKKRLATMFTNKPKAGQ